MCIRDRNKSDTVNCCAYYCTHDQVESERQEFACIDSSRLYSRLSGGTYDSLDDARARYWCRCCRWLRRFRWHHRRGQRDAVAELRWRLPVREQAEHPGCVLHLSLIHISEPTRLLSISYAVFC